MRELIHTLRHHRSTLLALGVKGPLRTSSALRSLRGPPLADGPSRLHNVSKTTEHASEALRTHENSLPAETRRDPNTWAEKASNII